MLTIQEILTRVNSTEGVFPIGIDNFYINPEQGKIYDLVFKDSADEIMEDFEKWLNDNCKEFSRAYDLYIFDNFCIRTGYISDYI